MCFKAYCMFALRTLTNYFSKVKPRVFIAVIFVHIQTTLKIINFITTKNFNFTWLQKQKYILYSVGTCMIDSTYMKYSWPYEGSSWIPPWLKALTWNIPDPMKTVHESSMIESTYLKYSRPHDGSSWILHDWNHLLEIFLSPCRQFMNSPWLKALTWNIPDPMKAVHESSMIERTYLKYSWPHEASSWILHDWKNLLEIFLTPWSQFMNPPWLKTLTWNIPDPM
jgi:hypothetical protein